MVISILFSIFSDTKAVDFVCTIPKRKPKFASENEPPAKKMTSQQALKVPLREIDANVRKSQASAFAEGTLSNLTNQWLKYLTFCCVHELPAVPATVDTLCRYSHYLSLTLRAHESILNYLSGVKTLHRLMGEEVKQFEDIAFKLALKGLHRNNSHIPHQAPSMTLEALDRIYKCLNMDDENDVIFWAVTLVGFFLLLRKCNLVPDTQSSFDPTKQLKREDLEFAEDHIKVTLRWTKTNQFGNKPLRFALPRIPGSNLCPVQAIIRLLYMVKGSPMGSLFQRSDGRFYT